MYQFDPRLATFLVSHTLPPLPSPLPTPPRLLFEHLPILDNSATSSNSEAAYKNLKRKVSALSSREPQKKKLKDAVKRMRLENPSLDKRNHKVEKEDKKAAIGETSNKTSRPILIDETSTPISIGERGSKINFYISEEQKCHLISASTLFSELFACPVDSDSPIIELQQQKANPKTLYTLIQLAISGEDLKALGKLSFDDLRTYYEAADELQMDKYKLQIKKESLAVWKSSHPKEKLARCRIIAEMMHPHTKKDLRKLCKFVLSHSDLHKVLLFMKKYPLDPDGDMNYMLNFMNQFREGHGIDQYKIDLARDEKAANDKLLKAVSYWLPDLKKFEVYMIVDLEDERQDLESGINFDIGFFAQLTEFTMDGCYELDDFMGVLKKYCPMLEKVTLKISFFTDVFDESFTQKLQGLESLPNLRDIDIINWDKCTRYSRENNSESFAMKKQ